MIQSSVSAAASGLKYFMPGTPWALLRLLYRTHAMTCSALSPVRSTSSDTVSLRFVYTLEGPSSKRRAFMIVWEIS